LRKANGSYGERTLGLGIRSNGAGSRFLRSTKTRTGLLGSGVAKINLDGFVVVGESLLKIAMPMMPNPSIQVGDRNKGISPDEFLIHRQTRVVWRYLES
jgi:hypothetical protein